MNIYYIFFNANFHILIYFDILFFFTQHLFSIVWHRFWIKTRFKCEQCSQITIRAFKKTSLLYESLRSSVRLKQEIYIRERMKLVFGSHPLLSNILPLLLCLLLSRIGGKVFFSYIFIFLFVFSLSLFLTLSNMYNREEMTNCLFIVLIQHFWSFLMLT